jgi:hypothetical protein
MCVCVGGGGRKWSDLSELRVLGLESMDLHVGTGAVLQMSFGIVVTCVVNWPVDVAALQTTPHFVQQVSGDVDGRPHPLDTVLSAWMQTQSWRTWTGQASTHERGQRTRLRSAPPLPVGNVRRVGGIYDRALNCVHGARLTNTPCCDLLPPPLEFRVVQPAPKQNGQHLRDSTRR